LQARDFATVGIQAVQKDGAGVLMLGRNLACGDSNAFLTVDHGKSVASQSVDGSLSLDSK
jgi:hypothetical protein